MHGPPPPPRRRADRHPRPARTGGKRSARDALANGECRLRSHSRNAPPLPRPRRRRRTAPPSSPTPCTFSLDELRYEYPSRALRRAKPPPAACRRLACEGLRWRYPYGAPEKVKNMLSNTSFSPHRQAEIRALLSSPSERRGRLRPLPRHPLPGARLGGQLGGLLLPRRDQRVSPETGTMVFERFVSEARERAPRYRRGFRT